MSVICFVDTNALVYARDADETEKQPLAETWLEALWRQRQDRLSYQVLREYYLTVTRKLHPGIPVQDADSASLPWPVKLTRSAEPCAHWR